MRRILLGLTTSALVLATISATPASAGCGVGNGAYGTAGINSSVITIGGGQAGDGSYYILDNDATGGGFFIYREVSSTSGLQRGGTRFMVHTDDCYEGDPDDMIF